MGNLSGESREQNQKDKVTRFRSVTYARQLELLVNTLGSHLSANQHNEIQHSWFAVYLQKTLYFLVFHRDIGLKTSIYEFTERIHQNKQGFDGKKLSGKEFVAFEEYQRVCVVDLAGSAILTVNVFLPRFSRLSCLLSSTIL